MRCANALSVDRRRTVDSEQLDDSSGRQWLAERGQEGGFAIKFPAYAQQTSRDLARSTPLILDCCTAP